MYLFSNIRILKGYYRYLIVIAATSLLSSCATIFNGSRQEVYVNSSPEGAVIKVNDNDYGVTPAVLSLRRKGYTSTEPGSNKGYRLSFEKEGYKKESLFIQRKMSPLIALNLALVQGLVFGVPLDFLTGGAYSLKPAAFFVSLNPDSGLFSGTQSPYTPYSKPIASSQNKGNWSLGLAAEYTSIYIEQATEKEKYFPGFSLNFNYSSNKKMAFYFSLGFTSGVSDYYPGKVYDINDNYLTTVEVEERWSLFDLHFALSTQLYEFRKSGASLHAVFGAGIRGPMEDFRISPMQSGWFYVDNTDIPPNCNECPVETDTYALLFTGLRYSHPLGRWNLFAEPLAEGTSVPELFGGSEPMRVRYRICAGFTYQLSKKANNVPEPIIVR